MKNTTKLNCTTTLGTNVPEQRIIEQSSVSSVKITAKNIEDFKEWLISEDRCTGTIEKYLRDIQAMKEWLAGRELSKENVSGWKHHLLESNYRPVTINSMLASVNTFCRYMGIDYKIKFLRIQKQLFIDENRVLKQSEYERLLNVAITTGKNRLGLLIETIGSTGIRVSEVKYITTEAAANRKVQITLKGKIRVIMLPKKLCRKLLAYAKRQKIHSGEIFITRNGKSMSRGQIWAEMKKLCKAANVNANKVFPHNLRHLFARVFYQITHDVAKLSDLLGHSCIDTTRIYLLSSGEEHARQLEGLGLVL